MFTALNVKWFGAKGDGAADDRVAIQAALDSIDAAGGGVLLFPEGTYDLAKDGTVIPLLELAGMSNIWLLGVGIDKTILRRAAGTYSNDTHVIRMDGGGNIRISDMTIDGNKDNCTDSDEQRHGVYIGGINAGIAKVRIERVRFVNVHGDGVFMIGQTGAATATDIVIQDCDFFNCDRSGIAMQSGCAFIWILNNTFAEIQDQAIDNEATGESIVSDVWIIGNKIYHNNYSTALALALGGTGDNRLERAYVAGNEVWGGGTNLINCYDIDYMDNRHYGDTSNRCFNIQSCERIRVRGGYFENNHNDAGSSGVIYGQTSLKDISIEGATIVNNTAAALQGIHIETFTSGLHLCNNTIIGGGDSGSYGIYASIATSNDGVTRHDLRIDGNDIRNFGDIGIVVRSPNSATKLRGCSVCHNNLWDSEGSPTMTIGIELQSGNNANFIANQSIVILGNVFGAGIAYPVSNPATVTPICVGGVGAHNVSTAGYGVTIWECIGTPESVITAGIGSMALRNDGGTGTCLYIKESGPTPTTGWIGK